MFACGGYRAAPAGGTSISGLLQAVDFLADEGLMQRVLVAYAERLFPPAAAKADSEFLRVRSPAMHEHCVACAYLLSMKILRQHGPLQVLEGMREEHVRMVLSASETGVGARAWLLPTRLHPVDEAIGTVRLYLAPVLLSCVCSFPAQMFLLACRAFTHLPVPMRAEYCRSSYSS